MPNSKPGLLGRKIGMTQIFSKTGDAIPVTAIELGPNKVIQLKKANGKDGYDAVQLGFGTQKPSRKTKAELGHFAKAGLEPQRFVREIRLDSEHISLYRADKPVEISDIFEEGQLVDITGTSKGRGFSGVMRRYGFRGFTRTHGTHEFFRHGGSIGTRLTPGMVLKGKKMPGHMGARKVTIQNLKIVSIDSNENLLFVSGGVPGPNGGLVVVRRAIHSSQALPTAP